MRLFSSVSTFHPYSVPDGFYLFWLSFFSISEKKVSPEQKNLILTLTTIILWNIFPLAYNVYLKNFCTPVKLDLIIVKFLTLESL